MLDTAALLFEKLHSEGIAYCHFKGNVRHLQRSLSGESDLDILFDKDDQLRIQVVLRQLGFKKFTLSDVRRLEEVHDYFALDTSGVLLHLHLHYRMNFGPPALKTYQLGMEQAVLTHRIYLPAFNTYVISREYELLFFYLREALRIRMRDRIYYLFYRTLPGFAKVIAEFESIRSGVDEKTVCGLAEGWVPGHQFSESLLATSISAQQLIRVGWLLKRSLGRFSAYSPLTAQFVRWRKEVSLFIAKVLGKISLVRWKPKRVNPRGGRVVLILAQVGSPAGKRIGNLLREVFEPKLGVAVVRLRSVAKQAWIRKLVIRAAQRAAAKSLLVIWMAEVRGMNGKERSWIRSLAADVVIQVGKDVYSDRSAQVGSNEYDEKTMIMAPGSDGEISLNEENRILSKVWSVM